MSTAVEKEYQHIGESHGCSDRNHDLIRELSVKLDTFWRYDQYIANAEACPQTKLYRQDLKQHCRSDILRIKRLPTEEMHKGCF